jgi:hypothetical protein
LFNQLLTRHSWTPDYAISLLRLGVGILLGLGDQVEAHRDTHFLTAIQRGQEINPFEHPVFGVVVMPTHNIVLVGVRLLLTRIVNNQHPGLSLPFPDEWLDGPPQLGRRFLRARQVSGHLVVADFPFQQLAQSGGGGCPKRSQQVIGIQIGYRVCFHTGDSTPFSPLSRKVRS